jgi:ankyrin repeat protein
MGRLFDVLLVRQWSFVLLTTLLWSRYGQTIPNSFQGTEVNNTKQNSLNVSEVTPEQITPLNLNRRMINHQDKDGLTALMHTAVTGNVRDAKKILKLGANVSVKNNLGDTALCMALGNDQSTWARWLIQAKPQSIDDQCAEHQTPASLAVDANDIESLRLIARLKPNALVAHDANANNLLHIAAKFGNTEVIQFLKRQGIALSTKNSDGKTPFDIAQQAQNPQAELLHERNTK